MARRTLDTRDWVHIPEHSWYNHNYYRNIHTGEIIFEESDDDRGLEFFEATEEQMQNGQRGNYIGYCWIEEFHIPNEVSREHGTADEMVFEFDTDF